jgi:hypothetical protein
MSLSLRYWMSKGLLRYNPIFNWVGLKNIKKPQQFSRGLDVRLLQRLKLTFDSEVLRCACLKVGG